MFALDNNFYVVRNGLCGYQYYYSHMTAKNYFVILNGCSAHCHLDDNDRITLVSMQPIHDEKKISTLS